MTDERTPEDELGAEQDQVSNGASDGDAQGVTRRQFLIGAGSGAVIGAAAGAGAMSLRSSGQAPPQQVIKEVEVPVESEAPQGVPAGMVALTLSINGREERLLVEPRWTLNYLLREKLGLTGTKTGCNRQMCGMCTVLADGRPIYSCTTLAVDFEGQDILTIEGLDVDGELHPVQQTFIEYNAYQCAWCTPGFIMSTVALLNQNPNPSVEETKQALSGNLCRCGTYREILLAVEAAGQMMA